MKNHDITGQRFHRLTAIRQVGNDRSGSARWLFACDCGKETTTLATHARSGHTRSCGCLWRESTTKHGESRSTEHQTWRGMHARCTDPSATGWSMYGARGIKVCDRWSSFDNFLADMGRKPSPELTLDRIDSNGDYEPGNCRWATLEQQSTNRRDNLHLTYQGRTQTLSQWAREIGITRSGLHYRLKRHPVAVAIGAGKRITR